MLILVLRALLFRMRAEAPFLARFRERRKRDRTLQREERGESEAAAPPVWAAKRAGAQEHEYRSLRRDGMKR